MHPDARGGDSRTGRAPSSRGRSKGERSPEGRQDESPVNLLGNRNPGEPGRRSRTCSFGSANRGRRQRAREGKPGEGSVVPRIERALRDTSPGEPCARVGLNRRLEVADSGVEQSPEGEGRSKRRKPGPQDAERSEGRWETMRKDVRHNDRRATGVGDGARLHARNKALKGETPSVDPARNKAGRHGADESVRRLRTPEGANALAGRSEPGDSRCPMWECTGGARTPREAPSSRHGKPGRGRSS
jgi:hypothetical protein